MGLRKAADLGMVGSMFTLKFSCFPISMAVQLSSKTEVFTPGLLILVASNRFNFAIFPARLLPCGDDFDNEVPVCSKGVIWGFKELTG